MISCGTVSKALDTSRLHYDQSIANFCVSWDFIKDAHVIITPISAVKYFLLGCLDYICCNFLVDYSTVLFENEMNFERIGRWTI
ncbi:hypothetical protein M0804_013760 [Polistes exclamans]|nr:hypothetical protein M0804_013760 [Polistes exclamans]